LLLFFVLQERADTDRQVFSLDFSSKFINRLPICLYRQYFNKKQSSIQDPFHQKNNNPNNQQNHQTKHQLENINQQTKSFFRMNTITFNIFYNSAAVIRFPSEYVNKTILLYLFGVQNP
jgi:hypothetical protein